MDDRLNVIAWVDIEDAEQIPNKFGLVGGFIMPGMGLKDYWKHVPPEYTQYIHALAFELAAKNWDDNSKIPSTSVSQCFPVFSDGAVAIFSHRAWGDFMAALWHDLEDKPYCYVDFMDIVFQNK